MPKSNGKRPVNKTDGTKSKAKKQMTKSRRADSKIKITKAERAAALKKIVSEDKMVRPLDWKPSEESIVEEVLNARNLIITPLEPVSEAPVFAETNLGVIRIEGEVTPAKIEAAKNFEKIFAQATEEILDLASYTPNPQTLAFVKGSSLTEAQTQEMLRAKPWSVFQVDGRGLMKTPDNRLETVEAYCYRLERAVIDVARAKNSEIDKLKSDVSDYRDALEDAEGNYERLKSKMRKTEQSLVKLQNQVQDLPFFASQRAFSNMLLSVNGFFDKVKTFLVSLISK